MLSPAGEREVSGVESLCLQSPDNSSVEILGIRNHDEVVRALIRALPARRERSPIGTAARTSSTEVLPDPIHSSVVLVLYRTPSGLLVCFPDTWIVQLGNDRPARTSAIRQEL